jgi:hypothetical protein
VKSLKLSMPEETKAIMVVDLWEVRVNKSWTLGKSTLGKNERRGVDTLEGRSPKVDEIR